MDLIFFILALSVLVLVHEWGHFIAARKTGVKVEEFGLGLPPRIIGKKFGDTIYSINWLMIGGFCRLYGEDGDGKGKDAFNNKNPWQKLLIVLGGVLMNLVLAVVIFSVVYAILGVPKETNKVAIIGISKDSPAEKAGLKENDVILKVADKEIKTPSELTTEVAKYKGQFVKLKVYQVSQVEKDFDVEVRENPPEGEGSVGIAISNTEMVKVPWYRFYEGIGAGFKEAFYWGKIIINGVGEMVWGLVTGHVPKDVSGPVGMYEATSSIKNNQGLLAVIHFFGIVSVNLAVVNVLPFPALDGGRIVFVLYEMIFRKKANQKFEIVVNNIGMMVLLGLILLITIGDIRRIF
ncbi:MAG: M50 family metallopeptidase [Candidatus Shapirobacteria bacterium]|nr:M50 family metallopeptidase [Candidatus Shapirobacteria bacterium]MDD4382746.1 M50 family metallopeptidase [Candidatus Shapirobacteria bacterium]